MDVFWFPHRVGRKLAKQPSKLSQVTSQVNSNLLNTKQYLTVFSCHPEDDGRNWPIESLIFNKFQFIQLVTLKVLLRPAMFAIASPILVRPFLYSPYDKIFCHQRKKRTRIYVPASCRSSLSLFLRSS